MTKPLKPLKFEWNKGNKDKNWIKHKVDFKECEQIFFNKNVEILTDTKHSQKEERFIALGVTNENRELFIVFVYRNKKIRIISARDMSQKERRFHEKK